MDIITNKELLNLTNKRIAQIDATQNNEVGRVFSISNLKILTNLLSNETYKLKPEISKLLRNYNVFTSGQVGDKSYTGESFVAMSDFHGFGYPIEQIKKYYLYEYDKIYILGDATDRGIDGEGTGSIQNLLEIKKLTEEYPDKVVYLAGNHDHFLMGAAIGIRDNREDFKKFGEVNLLKNGGEETLAELEKLYNSDRKTFDELTEWLKKIPLQRIHEYNGKRYALAHAFFNQTIYDKKPNCCLADLHYNTGFAFEDLHQILWFRTDRDQYNPDDCVKSGTIVVIGHTPVGHSNTLGEYDFLNNDNNIRYSDNYNLIDSNGDVVEVKCVDTGIFATNNMQQRKLLQYDGENIRMTVAEEHIDTSPKNIVNEEQMISDAFKNFVISSIYSRNDLETDFFNRDNIQRPSELSDEQLFDLVRNECSQYNLNCSSNDFKILYSEFKKTIVFDIVLENLFDKYQNLETVTNVMKCYLWGSRDNTIKSGDIRCITPHRNTNFLVQQLGVENIKSIISNHDCTTIDEYIELKGNNLLKENGYSI